MALAMVYSIMLLWEETVYVNPTFLLIFSHELIWGAVKINRLKKLICFLAVFGQQLNGSYETYVMCSKKLVVDVAWLLELLNR